MTPPMRTVKLDPTDAHPGLNEIARAATCKPAAESRCCTLTSCGLYRALAAVVPALTAQDVTVEAVHGVFSSRRRRLLQDESECHLAPLALA